MTVSAGPTALPESAIWPRPSRGPEPVRYRRTVDRLPMSMLTQHIGMHAINSLTSAT
jgi:hypothetical protein